MMMSATPPLILVLLPVYNGGSYLAEQLDSILGQRWPNLALLIRDDGSQDNSPEILRQYLSRYPQQIRVLQNDQGNLGAAAGFSLLMQAALDLIDTQSAATGCYIALADQDDIWHPDKLERCQQRMQDLEAQAPGQPALVHSDLRVVARDGSEIASSFVGYQRLRPAKSGLAAQLVSNTLTGCTALMNAALLRKALPIPEAAVMHDWWLSLVASAFGLRGFEPSALVDYRQHGGNALGARHAIHSRPDLQRIRALLGNHETEEANHIFVSLGQQARCFADRYGADLSPFSRWALRRTIAMEHSGALARRLVFRLLRRL